MKSPEARSRSGVAARGVTEGPWRRHMAAIRRATFGVVLVGATTVGVTGGNGAAAGAAITVAASCQVSWANPVGGSWGVPHNWSTGRVPTSAQNACITVPTTNPVTMTLTTCAARSLTIGTATVADAGWDEVVPPLGVLPEAVAVLATTPASTSA